MTTPTPAAVAAVKGMAKVNARNERVKNARANGYRGPFTRAELAAIAAAKFAKVQ